MFSLGKKDKLKKKKKLQQQKLKVKLIAAERDKKEKEKKANIKKGHYLIGRLKDLGKGSVYSPEDIEELEHIVAKGLFKN